MAPDLMTLDEISARLKQSPKTIRKLGLPFFRLTPHGPIYAFWSEIESDLKKRRRKMPSTGKFRP